MKETSLAVRISESLLSSLDEYAASLEARSPGLRVSRSDAVRHLLVIALELRAAGADDVPLASERKSG
jgi:hypothetical protein